MDSIKNLAEVLKKLKEDTNLECNINIDCYGILKVSVNKGSSNISSGEIEDIKHTLEETFGVTFKFDGVSITQEQTLELHYYSIISTPN